MASEETQQAKITNAFEERLEEARREFLDLEIEHMRQGEIEARQRIEKARKVVEEKRAAIEGALETARGAGRAAWEDARDGLESAWTELRSALDDVREEFSGSKAGEEGKASRRTSAERAPTPGVKALRTSFV